MGFTFKKSSKIAPISKATATPATGKAIFSAKLGQSMWILLGFKLSLVGAGSVDIDLFPDYIAEDIKIILLMCQSSECYEMKKSQEQNITDGIS